MASNALAGRLGQTQKVLARLRQLDPTLRVSNLRDRLDPYRRPEDVARYEQGLRKAGLPEWSVTCSSARLMQRGLED